MYSVYQYNVALYVETTANVKFIKQFSYIYCIIMVDIKTNVQMSFLMFWRL